MSDTTDLGSPVTVDPELTSMLDGLFDTHRASQGSLPDRTAWDEDLWSAMTELGLARLTGSEESGGSGATWAEAAALLRAAAGAGVSVPYLEHDLLAGWLLDTSALQVDRELRRSACVVDEHGQASAVGWAGTADRIVVLHPQGDGWAVSDIATSDAQITPGTNRAGEARDHVAVDLAGMSGHTVSDDTVRGFHLRGALARAIQVSAALEAILRLTLEHTTSRTQFGRPLARFQAVQHAVSDIAAEAALARTVTEGAILEAISTDWAGATPFRIAVARSGTGHAASVAVRAGHQMHGAIGTTREHRLHEFTRPALAWRSEFGSTASWDHEVAEAALRAGSENLWSLIVGDLPETVKAD